jgi:arginase family enzyme
LDAHADTRNSYHGSTHNHGCVMARVAEKCPIVQVGIRSLDGAEIRELDRSRVFWAHQIAAAATPAMSYSAIRPRMNASICGENPDGRPAQPVSKG